MDEGEGKEGSPMYLHIVGVKALQGLGMLDVSVKLRRQRFSGSMVRRFR